MKVIKGVPKNINNEVMGRITRVPLGRFKRKDMILATNDTKTNLSGYAGVIIGNTFPDLFLKKYSRLPVLSNVVEIEYLEEGDIVLINGSGQITVLYKRASGDNSILVTEECNSDCIMCPQPRRKDKESKTQFNLKLISLMDVNTTHIGITGGEPTLIKDELFEIINACKRYIPKAQIDILTNGIILSDFEYTKRMMLLQHPNIVFAVPLYADTDNEHNFIVRSESFYKTIQGIYNLALFNQKVEIRIVAHRINYNRLPALAEYIYHNFPFVYHIAFMGMEVMGLASKNINQLWIDPHDYMLQLADAVLYLNQRNMNVSIYNLQLCLLPNDLHSFSAHSISLWKNIYLEVCEECDLREDCGGFFSSSRGKHSAYISPINK